KLDCLFIKHIQYGIRCCTRAVAYYQHRHLVFACATCIDLLAAFARWTIQVTLTFAGKGKGGFIRVDDFLQATGFSSCRQSQEPMTPVKTGIFVCSALPCLFFDHGQVTIFFNHSRKSETFMTKNLFKVSEL